MKFFKIKNSKMKTRSRSRSRSSKKRSKSKFTPKKAKSKKSKKATKIKPTPRRHKQKKQAMKTKKTPKSSTTATTKAHPGAQVYAAALDGLYLPDPVAAFFNWCKEREAIRKRRESGAPAPWSKDPIFQKARFLNVFREDDRVTKSLLKFVKPVAEKGNLPDLI
jgi:hypothetical protein